MRDNDFFSNNSLSNDLVDDKNQSTLTSHGSATKFVMADYVINAINLTAATYILVSLIFYHLKNNENKTQKGRAIFVLNSLTFLNAAAAFVHTLKDTVILYNRSFSSFDCALLVNIAGGVPYFVGVSTAFGIIWWRQRKFYSDPKLQLYMSDNFAKLNMGLLVFFMALVVAVTTVVLAASEWVDDAQHCHQKWASQWYVVFSLIFYCVMTVFCQVSKVFLN